MECKADERHIRPSSSFSSMDSCGSEPPSTSTASSSGHRPAIGEGLGGGTDLRLGLSLQRHSCSSSTCIQTDNNSSGPCSPRSALTTTATTAAVAAAPAYERASSGGGHGRGHPSLFVKVSMEGIPIGRKVDLLLLDGYDGLLVQLRRMFMASVTITITITYHDAVGGGGHDRAVLGEKQQQQHARHRHVLTYEDKEGDWMMVGDVPWELFLTSVKKLRIVRADKVLR